MSKRRAWFIAGSLSVIKPDIVELQIVFISETV
jgi:hypothetical protein